MCYKLLAIGCFQPPGAIANGAPCSRPVLRAIRKVAMAWGKLLKSDIYLVEHGVANEGNACFDAQF
ncbi:hypothetical protein [Bradyrhizobium sp. I1.7.5]|uniref:hypothetical protein n=1 Tax=Bradyrhizobium sp. I1.7.5 TaxID=3156363 RepID=UPI00339493F5